MRILYLDCDSLRPDHLGCYGYDRDTSPNIDEVASDGRIFEGVYASDAPCLPSRTAFYTGRFGIHTGVINHGGLNADPRRHGSVRRNRYPPAYRTLATVLKEAGYSTAMVSPFPPRHDGWQVVEGFTEYYDTGGNGSETAEVVYPFARDWLERNGGSDDWYLHVNFWDPHTSYRTPVEYGDPFADDPTPEWLTEELIQAHYQGTGAHSAHDLRGWGVREWDLPRMPNEIASREDFGRLIDGYDVGVQYMDHHIGKLFDLLREQGVFEDTLIVISADHGENLGELNVYGDHQTADEFTCHLPLIMRGPQIDPGTDSELRYHLDTTATIAELAGGVVPEGWDGRSFAGVASGSDGEGRDALVLSQGAWACQRGVRWDDWLLLRTYHDAFKSELDELMLFDLAGDPHETTNLVDREPTVVAEGLSILQSWIDDRFLEVARNEQGGNSHAPDALTDPMWQVLAGRGPFYTWDWLERYTERLEATDRDAHAVALRERHG